MKDTIESVVKKIHNLEDKLDMLVQQKYPVGTRVYFKGALEGVVVQQGFGTILFIKNIKTGKVRRVDGSLDVDLADECDKRVGLYDRVN